jgi:anaerobic ribonucleoside-triphosphate reductase activating protein
MLYYSHPQIVVQEVPGEIALAFSISGCPLACRGCHSTETRNPTYGFPLTKDTLQSTIDNTKHVSCVLLYGGEWEPSNLIDLLLTSKDNNLKTCLYTGLTTCPPQFLKYLDYVKVGPYSQELGGLTSPTTNQKFFVVANGKLSKDITSIFNKG